MSTFNGLLEEISFISVDRFESHNMNSTAFFLSHCHSDHMVGLNNQLKLPGRLYCSEISAIFLKKQFPNLAPCIEILELEAPTIVFDTKNQHLKFVVTSLPAYHCPGSVMFIFETSNERLLYTGDFRHSKETLIKYPILTNCKFDKIFIDSTFLHEKYCNFPSQNESLRVICQLTKSWIEKGPEYKVIIEKPAQYCLESVFQELFRKLKISIWIEEKHVEKYAYFPEMDRCLSNNVNSCPVIIREKANFFNRSEIKNLEEKTLNFKYRILKPTAMFWSKWNKSKPMYLHQGNEIYRIAFSNHSSLNEIKDFLLITKPNEVKLNVIPKDCLLREQMENLLCKILQDFKIEKQQERNFKNEDVNFDNIQNIRLMPLLTNTESSKINLPPKRIKFK